MKRLGRSIRQQGRTLFVLAAIGLAFAGNAAFRAGWQGLLHGKSMTGHEQKMTPAQRGTGQRRQDLLPAKKIMPDYTLPQPEDGTVPVVGRIPTQQRVVFLTLDDGMAKTDDARRLLKEHGIQAPMFLNDPYVQEDPAYFRELAQMGMAVGSHTVDHADLTTLGYDQQVAEICTNADNLEGWLGRRPTLFRPPYGSYDATTLAAAQACGMRALVMWSAKANGGSMQYQDGNTGLVPGDVVLMHFRPEFAEDFQAFLDAAKAAGLQPENLADWLQ